MKIRTEEKEKSSIAFRYLYTLDKTCVRTKTDQTLEVIMTDLDREKMKIFYQEYTSSAAEATKVRFPWDSRLHFFCSVLSFPESGDR